MAPPNVEDAMAKPVLLMTGPMLPLIETASEAVFKVERLQQASDRDAFLQRIAGDVEAICTGGHTGVKTDAALIADLTSGAAPLVDPAPYRPERLAGAAWGKVADF